MALFVDLDGVLADFDGHFETLAGYAPSYTSRKEPWDGWEVVNKAHRFFASLPPTGDMEVLWSVVAKHNPTILTGTPSSNFDDVAGQKREWVAKHIGNTVPVICCSSADKCKHGAPGDILIDDWERYKPLGEAMGGRWITHRSARVTIDILREIGL